MKIVRLKWSQPTEASTDGVLADGVAEKISWNSNCRLAELNTHEAHLASFYYIIHQQILCFTTIIFKNVIELIAASINIIKSPAINNSEFT